MDLTTDQFHSAIIHAWEKWPETKDEVPDFGFKDWVKRVGGFEYKMHSMGRKAIISKIHDEGKMAWVVLTWA